MVSFLQVHTALASNLDVVQTLGGEHKNALEEAISERRVGSTPGMADSRVMEKAEAVPPMVETAPETAPIRTASSVTWTGGPSKEHIFDWWVGSTEYQGNIYGAPTMAGAIFIFNPANDTLRLVSTANLTEGGNGGFKWSTHRMQRKTVLTSLKCVFFLGV